MKYKNDEIYNIGDFQRLYEYHSCGYWFALGTKKFFKTKIETDGIIYNDSIYFISSEKGPDNKRKYTIRKGFINSNNKLDIGTVGQFQEFKSLKSAEEALKKLIQEESQTSKDN
jgi:hypothetical protein